MVEPDYPADAVRDRVEGTVEVVARVGRDGTIERVDSYSGPDILSAAATVAVRQWKYGPTYLYGHAIETVQHVKFVFRLPS
jgi:TonB family protein